MDGHTPTIAPSTVQPKVGNTSDPTRETVTLQSLLQKVMEQQVLHQAQMAEIVEYIRGQRDRSPEHQTRDEGKRGLSGDGLGLSVITGGFPEGCVMGNGPGDAYTSGNPDVPEYGLGLSRG
ncbi:hypothetical protein Sjap_023204 [Stephania japonica]|uniref:Uncharacterized protein n=1 Tax=Stephania japonica TaxID=461633 RepID=A0AAP0HMG1_9MAGN